MRHSMMPLLMLMIGAVAFSAHADPVQSEEEPFHLCKVASIKDWGDPKEIEQQVQNMGYTLISLLIERGCWEAKVMDEQKEIYEFYIHPASKEVILRKHKIDGPIDSLKE